MKILVTALAYALSLLVIAILAFLAVMLLADPHVGLLPSWLGPVVLVSGWPAFLISPVFVALKIWRRFGKSVP